MRRARRLGVRRLVSTVVIGGLALAAVTGWALAMGGAPDGTSGSTRDAAGGPAVSSSPAVTPGLRDVTAGTVTRVQVARDGSRRVTTTLRADTSRRRLVLAPPAGRGDHVQVRGLSVSAGGRPVVDEAGERPTTLPRTVRLPEPADEFTVSYTESGGVQRSSTTPGRALLAVTPLRLGPLGGSGASGNAEVTVRGGRLLSLTCARSANPPQPCGAATEGGGWGVSLPVTERGSRVYAQLDLPT